MDTKESRKWNGFVIEMELNQLYNMDCLQGLKEIPDNSIEACITDIPYGISFMAKDWDKGIPEEAIFSEIFRVLKYGAFFITTFTPRADMQLKLYAMLEKVGFNITFSPIYWTFASGFPKAQDLAMNIEKRLGGEGEMQKPEGEK